MERVIGESVDRTMEDCEHFHGHSVKASYADHPIYLLINPPAPCQFPLSLFISH
ncbi:hypothetical protein EGR_10470 [Echinococcus granulosus]|uniref:Uncharacterized protein n=1 Tax=Echinococcus granulosus TaxID=6210 RepID=W6U297_ECHGR|nr:hypothetical protein EGR_10470 [Echinococcus granulosus]EUB54671.1 hypothetical protein EGR_10470 [Echinococcus granulosus]